MRILHVIDSLSGSGGAEQGLVREVTRFSGDLEQRMVLLYDRRDLEGPLLEREISIDVIGFTEGSGSRAWPRAARMVRQLISEWRPDVIQTSLFLGNLVGQTASRGLSVPVVSNLVLSGDLELLRRYQPGASTRRAALLRSIAGRAARRDNVWFRALTWEVKESNAALLGVDPSRVTVIPRGVPARASGPVKSRDELGLPKGPLVVNVGRLAAQKGQALLVEAFATVHAEVPDAGLVIVGREGEASGEVRGTIDRLGLADSVTLVGHTPNVTDYLYHGQVFAFSSVMEGLGTAVLEAMAVGTPVVAFDIPPVREASVDGRHAELIPVGDVAAMASALIRHLGRGSRRDTEAEAWVRSHHDMQRIADQVEQLLRSAASGSAPAG